MDSSRVSNSNTVSIIPSAPKGFASLLEDLVIEILRNQPEDVTLFCAQRLNVMLIERNGDDGAQNSKSQENQSSAPLNNIIAKDVTDVVDSGVSDDNPSNLTTAATDGGGSADDRNDINNNIDELRDVDASSVNEVEES